MGVTLPVYRTIGRMGLIPDPPLPVMDPGTIWLVYGNAPASFVARRGIISLVGDVFSIAWETAALAGIDAAVGETILKVAAHPTNSAICYIGTWSHGGGPPDRSKVYRVNATAGTITKVLQVDNTVVWQGACDIYVERNEAVWVVIGNNSEGNTNAEGAESGVYYSPDGVNPFVRVGSGHQNGYNAANNIGLAGIYVAEDNVPKRAWTIHSRDGVAPDANGSIISSSIDGGVTWTSIPNTSLNATWEVYYAEIKGFPDRQDGTLIYGNNHAVGDGRAFSYIPGTGAIVKGPANANGAAEPRAHYMDINQTILVPSAASDIASQSQTGVVGPYSASQFTGLGTVIPLNGITIPLLRTWVAVATVVAGGTNLKMHSNYGIPDGADPTDDWRTIAIPEIVRGLCFVQGR